MSRGTLLVRHLSHDLPEEIPFPNLKDWYLIIFSGARMLYKNLPRAVGLRRITLHKTINVKQEVVYFLLVECSNFLEHIGEAANLLPVLRARICGYTGIFRCVEKFWQPPPLPSQTFSQARQATADEKSTADGYQQRSEEVNSGEAKGGYQKDIGENRQKISASEPKKANSDAIDGTNKTKKAGFFSSFLFGTSENASSSWQSWTINNKVVRAAGIYLLVVR